MRVLLIGANGQLGLCLQDVFPKHWHVKATTRKELDIINECEVAQVVDEFEPNVIINASAYTQVDKAEQEPEQADLVNHIGPTYLAKISQRKNICFIHISTDYVFDGKKQTAYTESDQPNPINVYGLTKLFGENAVLKSNPSAIIIRTSWVFSEYGNNFVKTMLRLIKEKSVLSVVNDQFGNPTYAGDLANVIVKIIDEKQLQGGLYHYSGDLVVSWYQFAETIFNMAKDMGYSNHLPKLIEISSEEYKTPAKRPRNSILSNEKIHMLGFSSSHWVKQLAYVIHKLTSEKHD